MAKKVIRFEANNGKCFNTEQEAKDENFKIKLRSLKTDVENDVIYDDECTVKTILVKIRNIFGKNLTKNTMQKIIEEIEDV